MREFYSRFVEVLKDADSQIGQVTVQDEVTDVKCEKCGRNMVVKSGRYGKFLACPGFPSCRNTRPITEDAGVACPKCGGKVLIRKTRRNRKYLGCENNPKCAFMTWDMPAGEDCPECGSFLVKKFVDKKPVFKCVKEGCGFIKGS